MSSTQDEMKGWIQDSETRSGPRELDVSVGSYRNRSNVMPGVVTN